MPANLLIDRVKIDFRLRGYLWVAARNNTILLESGDWARTLTAHLITDNGGSAGTFLGFRDREQAANSRHAEGWREAFDSMVAATPTIDRNGW
jgi:hypothetical protein